jgi:hypothetical protein
MHFPSDSYRLREAIIAERREERAAKSADKPAATRISEPKPASGKAARRPFFFMPPAFRFPLVAPAGKAE